MIIGTCHFVSRIHAVRYYHPQYNSLADAVNAVNTKLAEKSIVIGKPAEKPNQKIRLDNEGRYFIEQY